ncbi:ERV14 [Auxenochlorella protothecoides x Auxenochlorella symbiontica]|uniref:ER-derived vesicles protein ERV14 n=1 Tax=Auxenochlorella protothecoides TaxID=3075 RepID=A0A1D2A3V1_AUXPR
MPYEFLVWLLAVLIQAAVLAINMHITLQFTDLENDNTNPHDAASAINSVVLWEYGLEGFLAIWLILNGKWFSALLPLAILAFHIQQWRFGRQYIDVTEIYRQVKPRRQQAVTKLIVYLFLFAWILYSFIYVMLHSLLTPAGKVAAREILQEAAATLH